jgi:uncharacterized RDD family membrane protein YckC
MAETPAPTAAAAFPAPEPPVAHAAPPLPAPAPRYGGFWRRLWARLIDGIILSVALWPVRIVAGVGGEDPWRDMAGDFEAMTAMLGAQLWILTFSLFFDWLYFTLLESSPLQATPGKLALGLRVTDLHGQRVSFMRATGRWLGKIVSMLILFVGYLMVAFTERKQALHDLMAGTLVMRRSEAS